MAATAAGRYNGATSSAFACRLQGGGVAQLRRTKLMSLQSDVAFQWGLGICLPCCAPACLGIHAANTSPTASDCWRAAANTPLPPPMYRYRPTMHARRHTAVPPSCQTVGDITHMNVSCHVPLHFAAR